MLTAHTVQHVREAEERAIADVGAEVLMQRAAGGLAAAMQEIAPGERVLMLIGPGNNGGDALFAASHLCARGVHVDLCVLDPDTVHEPGWSAAIDAGAQTVTEPGEQDWIIDALFGIGARAPLAGTAAQWAEAISHASTARVISVDVPSGVNIDDATVPGAAIQAEHTITFGTYKTGLLASPSAEYAGAELATLVDIGLGDYLPPADIEALEPSDGHLLARIIQRDNTVHKYSRGVVGVAAGSPEYAGAAHLAVAGAQAGPAGMVRFIGSKQLEQRVVDRAPEVVAGTGKVQTWVVGPGSGAEVQARLAAALADGVATVIDADALNYAPESLECPAVLTPHAGELARMLGIERARVETEPLRYVRHAAERWNSTVVLKGKRTCIHTPAHSTRINLSGSTWLATAGAGDVLAGLIGSMLAAGLAPHDAASVGVFLHGAAAVDVNRHGPMTARQLPDAIQKVTADFLTGQLETVRQWR